MPRLLVEIKIIVKEFDFKTCLTDVQKKFRFIVVLYIRPGFSSSVSFTGSTTGLSSTGAGAGAEVGAEPDSRLETLACSSACDFSSSEI